MYGSTKAFGIQTIYIRLIDYCDNKCPFCGSSDVCELYPDSGHTFLSLQGWMHIIDYWFECLNPLCHGPKKFKAPHPWVLPYKKLGRDIWGFVINEMERYRSGIPEINLRLQDKGIMIDQETIGDIIEEYKLLKSGAIDEKTAKSITEQGKIIIGTDGTPTASGQPSLWTFYDVISGRLLYAEYIRHADAISLSKIFQDIALRYRVPITGFLSDHQPSVVNACILFNPDLPHQTCHYHYLRNHWDFIETKDTHLNQELRALVNSLPLNRPDSNGGTFYSQGIRVDKAIFFAPLMLHLKHIVNTRTKEFDHLKGMHAYEALSCVVAEIEEELKTCPDKVRPVVQLKSTLDVLKQGLEEQTDLYHEVCALNGHFQNLRITLGDPSLPKKMKIAYLGTYYNQLWAEASQIMDYRSIKDVVSKQPNYMDMNAHIYCQWCRLWSSHQKNLFFYYDIDGMEKTNIYNEQIFSQLKQYAEKCSGPAHKSHIVLTRGDRIANEICAKDTFSIQEVLTRYDLKEMKVLKQRLQEKISEQTKQFRNSPECLESVHNVMEKIRLQSWKLNGGLKGR